MPRHETPSFTEQRTAARRFAAPSAGGFALLIVILAVGLLALFGTELTVASRDQIRIAMATRDEAIVKAAADGGVRQAIFDLTANPDSLVGHSVRLRIGDAAVTLSIEDEASKINPNSVPRDVLRRLLLAVGVDPPNAAQLAAEIVDWRGLGRVSVLGGPKDARYQELGLPYGTGKHAFSSLSELGLVADMTPEMLARLRPWVSIHQEGNAVPGSEQTPVSETIADSAATGKDPLAGAGFVSKNRVFRVTAVAVLPARAQFTRTAVVRLRHGPPSPPGPGMRPDAHIGTDFIQILDWN